MSAVKEELHRLVEELSDDATLRDFTYTLYVREAVAEGLRDAEEGRVISNDEMKRRIRQWLQK